MINEDKTKYCPVCKSFVDITKFNRDKSAHDGYGWRCSKCQSDWKKSKYKKDLNYKDKILKINRNYHDLNKDRRNKEKNEKYHKDGEHVREKSRKWREDHPIEMVNQQLLIKYGIDINKYNEILAIQEGACAICQNSENGRYKRLSVDHDHKTMRIRGLLCHKCNRGIGLFMDSVLIINAAIGYLNKINRPIFEVLDNSIRVEAHIRSIKRRLNVSNEEIQLILKKQNGCAICGDFPKDRLAIDHDHETLALRGVLCSKCNFGIGIFKDSSYLLQRAINYLTSDRNYGAATPLYRKGVRRANALTPSKSLL